MRATQITHVALELSSPTRMERYLRDVFGLQLLRHGYWRGEYVRVIGSPHAQSHNPPMLVLYNRPFIPRGRLRYLGVAVEGTVDEAVISARRRGFEVDGEDIVVGPGSLAMKIDSLAEPRPAPADDPATRMADATVDLDLPCLVRGIHHVALDVAAHQPTLTWMERVFGMDLRQRFDRRGEFIVTIKYSDAPLDAVGRRQGFLPLFLRHGIEATRLNHIAFDIADADAAIGVIESRGAPVDLWQDAMIHGPEEVWFQIDSHDTPYPIGHPANEPGVPLFPYRYD